MTREIRSVADLDALDFSKGGGVVTIVAQDVRSGQVLMVAHADREALDRTVETGEMWYRSRTRGLWHKGATTPGRRDLQISVESLRGDGGDHDSPEHRRCKGKQQRGGGESPWQVVLQERVASHEYDDGEESQ